MKTNAFAGRHLMTAMGGKRTFKSRSRSSGLFVFGKDLIELKVSSLSFPIEWNVRGAEQTAACKVCRLGALNDGSDDIRREPADPQQLP